MNPLDLIRSLRRALVALRDADNPLAVCTVASVLAAELEAKRDLGTGVSLDALSADPTLVPSWYAEMAVIA
jgi:hypothetical protein